MHDQTSVETVSPLELRMRMVPECAGLVVADFELVGEGVALADWALREADCAIHFVRTVHV